ncbi:M23 family metallopeptidase [Novosphingobium sp.]|uniref:M23 family metallopeptidase n=1 Tax=Novosphingobium sp. TaxID=1874826 RepID=UPI00333FD00F
MRTHAALVLALLAGVPGAGQARPAPIIAWSYTVQQGDTLAAIAARMGIAPSDLARANHLDPDAMITPGMVLKRPDATGSPHQSRHTARTAPRVVPDPVRHPAPRPAPAARAPAWPDAPVVRNLPGTPRLVWPTSGALVTAFGATTRKGQANGIDLVAFAGMPVRAAAAGRVIFAGTEPERFGQLIVIDHGGGWATAYAYLGKVAVHEGTTVRAGAVIARIGASGEVKKPTLHFELRHDNVPRDPIPALPIRL